MKVSEKLFWLWIGLLFALTILALLEQIRKWRIGKRFEDIVIQGW